MSRLQPRAVREVSTGDVGTDRVQEELARKTRDMESCPILQGVSVSASLPNGVATRIAHKLGRKPQGFIVTDLSGDYGPAIQRNAWDDRSLTITHSGAATLAVQLWVY